MANEIIFDNPSYSGLVVYATVKNSVGQIYAGTTPETPQNANWTTYPVTMTEAGTTGIFRGTFPVLAAGVYPVTIRQRVGGTAAVTDPVIGDGQMNWNGTAEVLPLSATTAGRTLDVSATGEAGLDFDNIKDATGAHTLTNIRVPNVTLTDTTTTLTNPVTLANGAHGGAGASIVLATPIQSDLRQILGSAITGTASQLVAAFTKWFNVASPTGTVNSLPDAVAGTNGGLPTTNGTKVSQTVDLTAGQTIASNLTQILGTALTETSGLIAAAFKKFFNVATPTGTVNSIPDAVAGATGGISVVGSAMTLTSGERDSIAAALLDLAAGVETSVTVRQALRGMAAALLSKSTNFGNTFRDLGDTKNRIVATVDDDGNRTAVTRDLT